MMRSLSVAALATVVAGDFPHMNPGVDYIVSNPAPGAEVRSRLLSLFSSSPAHSRCSALVLLRGRGRAGLAVGRP
jgi:hypothetical protein